MYTCMRWAQVSSEQRAVIEGAAGSHIYIYIYVYIHIWALSYPPPDF